MGDITDQNLEAALITHRWQRQSQMLKLVASQLAMKYLPNVAEEDGHEVPDVTLLSALYIDRKKGYNSTHC